jgi:Ca-activated chloride channel family protein
MQMKTRCFVVLRNCLGPLFWGLLFSSAPARAQENPRPPASTDEVLRVETTLVTLPVTVLDRRGKLLPDLKREQFHIYENGVEQEIAYFEPPAAPDNSLSNPAQQAFTVALLLDVSDSTTSKLEEIQRAALAFVDLLRPDDRVMVISFDKSVQFLTEATTDREAVRKAIARTRTGGGTSMYSALESVIKQHLDRAVGRKAIVLLTDGVDTSSHGATSDSAMRAAEASDAVIYPIQYNTYGDFADSPGRETYGAGEFGKVAHVTKNGEPASEAYKRATLYLRLLADKTGGHFQYADSLKNLTKSFEGLASKLRQQYTLGYYPKNKAADGNPRQIKVEVEGPKVTVRTRKTYIYKRTSAPPLE